MRPKQLIQELIALMITLKYVMNWLLFIMIISHWENILLAGASNTCNQGFNEQETSRLCGLQFGAVGTIDMQMFAISNICSEYIILLF